MDLLFLKFPDQHPWSAAVPSFSLQACNLVATTTQPSLLQQALLTFGRGYFQAPLSSADRVATTAVVAAFLLSAA